jgi:hypothetical protein
MFVKAEKLGDRWLLTDRWGHDMSLPAIAPSCDRVLRIGTLGTRFDAPAIKGFAGKIMNKLDLMAAMLRDLAMPIYLLDVRRNGVGAQGAWAPEQFATQIPDVIGNSMPYAFLHLPALAPTIGLLSAYKSGAVARWQDFRDCYCAGIDSATLNLGVAFCEAAFARGGMAVFLCAEAFAWDFDRGQYTDTERNQMHCHRFSLVNRIAACMHAEHAAIKVERVDLDVAAYARQRKSGLSYSPLATRL